MKKSLLQLTMIIPLVILLCFTFSYQQGEEVPEEALGTQALTDAQIVEIKDTLIKKYGEFFAAMMEMNVDDMFAYYSDTDFQELLMGIRVYTSLDSFKNDVIEMLSARESQSGENLEIKVTILSPDTAYVSAAYDYTINYKDGRKYEGKGAQTSIWEKGTAGWKITHDHVSWAGKYLEE